MSGPVDYPDGIPLIEGFRGIASNTESSPFVVVRARDVPPEYWERYRTAYRLTNRDGSRYSFTWPYKNLTSGDFIKHDLPGEPTTLVVIPASFVKTHNEWGEICP